MLRCPQCGSTLLYKDGLRYLADGSITKSEYDAHQKAAKLLVEAQRQTEKQEAGATKLSQMDVKGKV